MKPISELRRMAVAKAHKRRERYAWVYSQDVYPHGEFEIIDAGYPSDPLCDVIVKTRSPDLRDMIIQFLESQNYSPARWS